MSYAKLVATVLGIFVPESEIPHETLQSLITESLKSFVDPQILPVVHVDENVYVLEMFHGLTGAFKVRARVYF